MKIESYGRENNRGFIIPAVYCRSDNKNIFENRESLKIVYMKSGEKIVKINGKEIRSKLPLLILLSENEKFEIVKEKDVSEIIMFSPSLINSKFSFENIKTIPDISDGSIRLDYFYLKPFIQKSENYNGVIELGKNEDARSAEYIAAVYKELNLQPDNFWPCRGRMTILEMLYFIENIVSLKREDGKANSSSENKLLKEITTYIGKNYDREISIFSVCRELGINRTKLQEVIKSGVNKTFNEYLLKIRVDMACNMLSETMLPIIEVMYGTGFNNSSNFNRIFKRETKLTPKEYRKQYSKFSL